MHSDTTTRVLLAVIAVCLVILVVQGFGAGGAAGTYRYQVTAIRAGTPLLIRTDMVTGQVWKSELRGGRGRWIAFSDPEDSVKAQEPAAIEKPSRPEPPGAADLSMSLEDDLDLASPDRATLDSAPEPRRPAPVRRPAPAAGTEASDFARLAKAAGRTDLPPDIRIWALRLLADSEDPRSTDLLLAALGDDDARVVTAALGALGERSDERVTEAVRALEDHPDPAVQAAAKALLAGSS